MKDLFKSLDEKSRIIGRTEALDFIYDKAYTKIISLANKYYEQGQTKEADMLKEAAEILDNTIEEYAST